MELEVRVNDKSISITISDPYRPDIAGMSDQINKFASENGVSVNSLDIPGLLPKLIRGVVGCEQGCPANARDFVAQGYRKYTLNYVEGGILTAEQHIAENDVLTIKLFPDF